MKPFLNPDHESPAYHCGRLLAVLAALQKKAIGNVGAGVIQRYYASASTTPALVLGPLIRNSQHHLQKLHEWQKDQFQKKMAEVLGAVDPDNLPAILEPTEQSLFALGYYQQLAHEESLKGGKERQSIDKKSESPAAEEMNHV